MSIVQLLNVNELNNSYEHTIDFPDLETQTRFFDDKVNTSIDLPEDDYVYIRESKTIEVDKGKQELLGVNYLRFNNGNKWWYAFIVSKEYINESVTSIQFEIDVIQTFMFDYEIKESFISREHQDRFANFYGTYGRKMQFNTKPEDFDIGSDYIEDFRLTLNDQQLLPNIRVMACLICSHKDIQTGGTNLQGNSGPTNIIPDPLRYYIIPIVERPSQAVYIRNTNNKMLTASQLNGDIAGRSDYTGELAEQVTKYANIINMTILPYFPFEYSLVEDGNGNYIFNAPSLTEVTCKYASPSTPQSTENRYLYALSSDILKDTLVDFGVIDLYYRQMFEKFDFTKTSSPSIERETKLFTYPFSYFTLDTNQNEPLILKPQFINAFTSPSTDNMKFKFNQAISTSPITKYYLEGYKGDYSGSVTTLINNSVNDLTVASSALADYLALNKASATTGIAVNTALDLGVNALRTGVGMATGNTFTISNAISGVSGIGRRILNENFKRQDLEQGPLNFKSKGNNIYSYMQQYGKDIGVQLCHYDLKGEYKNFAYKYFRNFGYACKEIKTPDLKSRYYFNYIEIPDVNLSTNIDNEYIQQIKNVYSKGITIWHYRNAEMWGGIFNYQYENGETRIVGDN